jgi:hypothetical protein
MRVMMVVMLEFMVVVDILKVIEGRDNVAFSLFSCNL